MFKLKIPIDNVSLRAFLYLIDLRNLKSELSNTTICDYILETFKDIFTARYKDMKSFRSGYAGNLALIFDSDEALSGNMNKFTKVLDPLLKKTIVNLKTVRIRLDGEFCIISQIPTEEDFQLLSVFFNLKPINAMINRKVNLAEAEKGWLSRLCAQFSLVLEDMPPHPAFETGRGKTGSTAILNRYTIYNRGNIWFDVLKPNYYNFKNLRYKLYLRSLLIEQDNLFYCLVRACEFDFDFKTVFDLGISLEDDTPLLKTAAINDLLELDDVILISKEKLKPLIINHVETPRNYQYMFTLLDNFLVFQDGTMIDISAIAVKEASEFMAMANFNPNITFDKDAENAVKKDLTSEIKRDVDFKLRRISRAGEESHTVMKFIEKSNKGLLKVKDYRRNPEGYIEYGEEKTCLIVFNGTRYPDFLCIFLEDAEKVEKRGARTYYDYTTYMLSESGRFRHLFFEVEAEYNQSSFKSHDTSAESLMKCKYIFCENKTSDLYQSRYKVSIPVVGIREIS
ncbi:MAG: hypothetical protein B6241_05225 [Spirochaetaceae bacterium 4572_59]|nr:MAG: hypothetical protein B6241_05225 [Spirochaetaceae bacterium 4572_59]